MNRISTTSSSVQRTALLMLAGASVALILTDTVTRMQGAVAGIRNTYAAGMRNTYKPCVHARMTGDLICACVVPAAAKVWPRTTLTRRTL